VSKIHILQIVINYCNCFQKSVNRCSKEGRIGNNVRDRSFDGEKASYTVDTTNIIDTLGPGDSASSPAV